MMWSMLFGTLSLLLPRMEGFSVWQQPGRCGFCALELAAGIRKGGGKAELYPSERKDLYKSEGSRALTKSEQKAKDQYEASREPFVNRLVPQNCASREPLTHLQTGQKFRGRIISVKEFGMFVDIGSQKDGLVHVKDVSKDYFIQNLASKFSPGQDVDVWVKFCDDKEMKLGLQMFPITRGSTSAVAAPGPREAAEIIQALSVGQPVSGTVVRVSNYGVYVDVGAGVDAYLHKRKMKMGRKMMKLLPWEISPIGSSVQGWVHEVSHMRGRVSITTYNPSVWGEMLPAPAQGRLDSEDEAVQKEDDEDGDEDEDEDGIEEDDDGRDAVARTLALSLDDEESEEDSVGGERSVQLSVSDLSPKELRALEQKRAGRVGAAVVMDDFGSAKRGKEMKTVAKNSNSPERVDASLAGEEISTSELFAQISYNRPTIGLKDIKQWDYMRGLLQTEVITDDQIKQLIGIHGEAGRISEDQFEGFLEMLVDGLELGQDGEEGEEGEDGEEEVGWNDKDGEFEAQADDRLAVLMDDTQDIEPGSVLPGDYLEDIRDDQELINSMGSAFSPSSLQAAAITPGSIPPAGGLSALSEKKPKSNDLFQYVFASVAGKKGYVTSRDVIGWDFARALISQGAVTELACIEMFERVVKKTQVKVRGPAVGEVRASADAFDVFVGELSNIQGNPSSPQPDEILAADDDGEEMSLDDCFAALSGGKDTVTEMAVFKWDVVQELVQAGAVSRETFGEMWRKAGPQGRKSLTIDGFEKLLDLLAPFAEEQDESMDNVRVSSSPSKAASAQVKPVSTNRGGAEVEQGEEEEDEVIMGEEEGDYFDVNLEEEFMQLADGRKTIKFSDLQRWELIKQMRAVGLMDDAELRDVCDSAGVGNLDKIDVFDFEGIVEVLSNRSDEDEEEEEDEEV